MKTPQTTQLLKCALIAIDEPKLLAAVEDYNKLSNISLITNLNRDAPAVAMSFLNGIMKLTDDQCDLLSENTIDLFNFLVTKGEVPDDFMPSEKIFPLETIPEALHVPKSTKQRMAADVPYTPPFTPKAQIEEQDNTPPSEANTAPSEEANKMTAPELLAEAVTKQKVHNEKERKQVTLIKTKSVKQSQPKAPKATTTQDKYKNPTGTIIVRACVIAGITTIDDIDEVVINNNLSVSKSTIITTMADTRATLEYLDYLKQGGVALCKK